MASTKIKQHDIKDCGAACLASIGNHYDVNLPIARIRQYANTDKRGTNVLGIIEAAEKMGFTAKGVKGGIDAIDKIPYCSRSGKRTITSLCCDLQSLLPFGEVGRGN